MAPVGQDDKRLSAVLHSLALATASAALLRLAAKRFSSCCTRQYKVVGVLGNYVLPMGIGQRLAAAFLIAWLTVLTWNWDRQRQ